jgi:serine-type D-Ala-D-Ala carboxypeptidase (penicillin-binding protein 5/6)
MKYQKPSKFKLPKIELKNIKLKHIILGCFVVVMLFTSLFVGKMAKTYVYYNRTKDLYSANIIDYSHFKPFRNWKISDLQDLTARSAISIVANGKDTVVYELNKDRIVPIASLTKLMTAYVVLDNYLLDDIIVITQEAVDVPELSGTLTAGEQIKVKDLLYSMLVESSNDAAYALAADMGMDDFIFEMNRTAKKLELDYTHFVNPIGLDPEFEILSHNYSTAYDLGLLAHRILDDKPEIFEMTRNEEVDLYYADGRFHHKAKNTNAILDNYPTMLGGKTGTTNMAGQCLLVIMPQPKHQGGYIINVILGSTNRFSDMEKILNWQTKAFIW